MALEDAVDSGQAVGPYRIVSPLGRGGMGVVYRASDTRLSREVAIKMLPPEVADDEVRVARLEREARILASLSHPNVAALYGIERDGERTALVLELVEGQTLADRLALGPMVWGEVLAVARQVARALDAVHEAGIVHRDLKPANITLTPTGDVKVLDFGLAKPIVAAGGDTITHDGTSLLGTIAYMSPEQARGFDVDKRCDIWAFGCIVFEMLTGRSPFAGGTTADTLAAILEREPEWSLLPVGLSPDPRPLIRRCLQKDPRRRLRDIGDVDIAWETMREATSVPTGPLAPPRSVSRRRDWRLAAGVAVVAVAALVVGSRSTLSAPPANTTTPVTRFEINTETPDWVGIDRPVAAFSPDGSRLVYLERVGRDERLALRSVDAFDVRAVPGSSRGRLPMFSPDGQSIGFFTLGSNTLRVSSMSGAGARDVLALSAMPRGATWTASDEIIVGAASTGPLRRIRVMDAEPPRVEAVGLPDGSTSVTEVWPEGLPGGSAVLCAQVGDGSAPPTIVAVSLATGARTPLVEGTAPHYIPSGYLVFHRGHALMGVRFDAQQLKLLGTPVVLIDDVPQAQGGVSQVAVSRSGDVAYATSVANRWSNHLVLVDRQGHSQQIQSPARGYAFPRVSPDGSTVVVMVNSEAGSDIWSYSLVRGTWNQITSNGSGGVPIWTRDGHALVYSTAFRNPASSVYQIALEGGTPTLLSSSWTSPHGFSPDGRYLVGSATGIGVVAILLSSTASTPLTDDVRTAAPALSPDGRWLAYSQTGDGQDEGRTVIYVRRFLAPGGRWRISPEGGSQPRWSRDGRELYYMWGERMMAVRVSTAGDSLIAERPVPLFEGRFEEPAARANFDVLPDGRFVMVKGDDPTQVFRRLRVVRGWEQEVRRLVDGAP